jgi:hypothetical protein
MNDKDIAKKLQAPFNADQIEWRINRKGFSNGKPWATAIPYLTSRAVQDRLDDVFGPYGWQNQIKMVSNKGFLTGISFKHEGEWVTKWDGAEGSDSNGMDLIKSGSSNALKRAAVLLGIGRYLYDLEEFFVKCEIATSYKHPYGNVYRESKGDDKGKLVAWETPSLPEWALPRVDFDKHHEAITNADNIPELKECFGEAWKAARINQNVKIQEAFKQLYDARIAHFEQLAAQSIAKDTESITAWIDSQAMGLALVPTVSASELAYKRLTESLAKKCQNTFVDVESLNERLYSIYTNHIENLQKGEAA